MSEDRPGEGRVVSSTEAKDLIGRGFIRAKHLGNRSDPTEFLAGQRLEKGLPRTRPTQGEMDDVFARNQSDVEIFRAEKMSDEEIYEIIKDRR